MIFKSMFKSGGTMRWFISETVVVVVGVLLALALNDYWTERQERQLEMQYLHRLKADLTADADFIQEFYSERIALKLASLNAVAPVIRGQSPLPDDPEEFLKNVSLGAIGGTSPSQWNASGTYDDLVSTGNIRLINDVNLRRGISLYYKFAETLHVRSRDRRTAYAAAVHAVYPSELRDDMTSADVKAFGMVRAIERIMEPDFEDLLNQEFNFAYFVLPRRVELSERGLALIESIDARIDALEGRQ